MINPMIWLELRIRVREKRLWIIALFFVFALAVIMGTVMSSGLVASTFEGPGDLGMALIWTSLFCHAGLLVILAPLAAAGRISQEREQRTMPALVNSQLSALRLAWGKLTGSWSFVIWLGCLVLPFLFVATLWGGPSWRLILLAVGLNLYAGMMLASVSLGLSGLFGRSLTSYLVTGVFLFAWIAVMPMLGAMTMGLNHSGGRIYQQVILWLTIYHNPFYPLAALAGNGFDMSRWTVALQIIYAVAVWTLLGAIGLRLAVKGFKREVY